VNKRTTYADAGVNINAADETLRRVQGAIRATHGPSVLRGLADFGGMFALGQGYHDPVLVSGTDGVGTKLKIAFVLDKHDTVGQDLVAMNVDDIVCMGARPLFFLDYLGIGKLRQETATQIIEGVAAACARAGCALLGGELAELPGMYADGEYDLVGFAVGIVEREQIVDGSEIRPDDVVLGLASSGLHSNGYSLARKALLEMAGYRLDQHIQELGCSLGEELLKPTRLYCQDLVPLLGQGTQPSSLGQPKGIAHITGGGWYDNIARLLPAGMNAQLDSAAVPVPPVFTMIQTAAQVQTDEMYRTFNMGLGMAIVLAPEDVDEWTQALTAAGQQCFVIGTIGTGAESVQLRF